MRTRNSMRVLAVILMLAVVVTACKPSAGGAAAAAVDQISLEGKNVEVVLWHNRSQSDQDLLQTMLDEFNASNPYGITARAEIAGASYNDVYNKINAAIQAGSPPNIAVAYQNQAAFYRSQDAVIDLSPYINSSKYGLTADDKKDYFAAFLASDANPQFKGETLGFPTQRSLEVMYYNADWLKQLGYDKAPTDWKTWEEAACKASQESGKAGWAFIHEASNFASQIFSRGGRILAEDGQSYVFNSQAGQDTLAMIQRMAANKCLVEIPVSERYGEQNRFANGDVLFVFASSSGMNYYADAVAKAANFKWDIAPLPQTGDLHMNLYGASMSVFKTTPEQQLASWLVIKFLGEKAQTTRWAAKTGYLPVRASAKEDVIAAFKADPKWGPAADSYAKLFDWANAGMVESPVAGYDPVRSLIDTDVMSVVINDPKADVKSLLDTAVTKANAILKENAPQ
ncbi:MAG: extracellular solute-binding protein [Chloroflexi bacterium]|nr:extracellular solute-binding protein [Chloroflexota bacterium]